jgi:hypothetical protein
MTAAKPRDSRRRARRRGGARLVRSRRIAPADERLRHRRDGASESWTPDAARLLAPNVLSVKHWNRLVAGLLYADSPRIDWASLLRRSFEVDVLACPSCGERLRVLGEVTEPAMVTLVLESLGIPSRAPRVARARDPTELLGERDTSYQRQPAWRRPTCA